ncbi:MAG: hypothetical protein K6G07_07015 [Lachnospiraceae bacterium]|nr:hypothetical protein [Lachnospiraceae bacterium]
MAFCPICKNEYRPGFTMCAECKVPLVESLEEIEKQAIAAEEAETIEAEEIISRMEDMSEEEREALQDKLSDELEEMKEQREKLLRERAYENKYEKAAEYRSSAYVLILVGLLGIVVLILLYTGVISGFSFLKSNYLFLGVMGTLFAIFIKGGVVSFNSVKKMSELAKEDDKHKEAIRSFIESNLSAEIIDASANFTEEDTVESKYFKRMDVMSDKVKEWFPEVSEALVDSLLEESYKEIYEDNDH